MIIGFFLATNYDNNNFIIMLKYFHKLMLNNPEGFNWLHLDICETIHYVLNPYLRKVFSTF